MNADSAGWLTLQSEGITAQIDPQGAQLSLLRDAAGRDLLWNGDPAFWNGRAPILFPIVGTLNGGTYLWKGRRYALPRHGFARGRRFEVLRHETRLALFRLKSDDITRAVYPFAFELEVRFRIENAALLVEASVHNTGDVPLPASLGFHPAFRWPLPSGVARGAHVIEFETEEPAGIRRLDADGLLTEASHPTPVHGRTLKLTDGMFTDDVVIFDQLKSRALTYGAWKGPRIRLSFPDATFLGLWSKPGAPFICIEPWRGVADPAGFARGFDAKPGVFIVAPRERQSLQMRIELLTR